MLKKINNNKPTLAESINYETELKDYRFVQIFSGVGSGKNYFIERFLEGDAERGIPKKTVLIITSRKAKVQEVLADNKTDIESRVRQQWDEYYHYCDDCKLYDEDKVRTIVDDWGEHRIYQKSVVCTNAFVEQYLKYIYNPQCAYTHLWELFDIIIIDEVHSVVMDATYQSAPFYIHELVNEIIYRHKQADENPTVCKRPQCEQIIMMTGTDDPIRSFSVPKSGATVIDRMDVCKRVQPRNVRFIEMKEAKEKIAVQLATGERIVYFQNHTTLPNAFCENTEIDPSLVVPSFSKEEKRNLMKKENERLYKKMEAVERSICESGTIPQEVKLFLTTGRNKEGININDEDIKAMYVESHLFSDIVQMAGRVRTGVEDLYIIVDSTGYASKESKFDMHYTRKRIVGSLAHPETGSANEEFKYLCKKHGVEGLFNNRDSEESVQNHKELADYVKFVHERYPFVKYSYFDNVFKYYSLKSYAMRYQRKSLVKFNQVIKNTDECVEELKKWFPEATIHPYYSNEMKAWDIFCKYVPVIEGAIYSESELLALKKELQAECYSDLNSLQAMLNKFTDLTMKRVSNTKKNPGYKKRRFIRRQSTAA